MKIYYSIVAGIALMIGCMVSGCKRDNKTNSIHSERADSLLIINTLKSRFANEYRAWLADFDTNKVPYEDEPTAAIRLCWTKEIRPGISLKYYISFTQFCPDVGHVYILENETDKRIVLSSQYQRIKTYDKKQGYENVLSGSAFEDIFPELLIRDAYAYRSFIYTCQWITPLDVHVSPKYFLDLKNVAIIKDKAALDRYVQLLDDTATIIPFEMPDTSEIISRGQILLDTASNDTKVRMAAAAREKYKEMTKRYYKDMKTELQAARDTGLLLLPEIRRTYMNKDYTYFYRIPELKLFRITHDSIDRKRYSLEYLVPKQMDGYYFVL